MKSAFLCLAVITQLVLAESNPTRIPLFKRHYDSDFVAAPAKELYNGMMGAVVQIGSPPQNLTMAFDTSAGFSWVAGDKCTDENCQGRKKFKPEESNSIIPSNKDFIMDYGKGIVHTTLYQDTFRYSGITVRDLPFGVAYHMYKFNRGYDGFLGLGRNINLNSAGKHYAKRDFPPPGFVPNAFQQGSGVQSQQFGMYTTTAGSGFTSSGNAFADSATQTNGVNSGGYGVVKRSVDDEADGYLIIGGLDDDAIEGDLYRIDLDDHPNPASWAVPVRDANFIDDLEFEISKKAKAVLNSNTDVIGLPNKQAEEFRKHWYAEYDEEDNTFLVPCCLMDRFTSFQIQFGNVVAVIPPEYWSHPRKTDTCCEMCRTHIGRSESDTDFVIGYALTNAYYTHFDAEDESIGLAMKKCQPDNGLELYKVNDDQ